ncbi:N-acetyl-gamma-glutamyl-phosphate reductase [Paenibacillus marchantiophytorum]|uniref:N-acetyl-gamma-glutamyl-phosphate reductase n=1 Tax=Paenibacillus marchantiophytorum TaxID=1619310 RepID=A0ABQ1F7B4_9BACL|nr:N-acetyl-gamma-glutamyl-phosphate reductase [Paenibacillus marchantiophytorum]GGA00965.1 N-acetyl-gamma-glutamyl-phosphate reductase [Paenibacillus marchantiophytorum]
MKVFVDGQYGTTGLKIHERLNQRNDVEVLSIPEEQKKDSEIRIKLMNEADIVFLCLPDQAAREALKLIINPNTRVIDSSSAFRTHDAWTYGLPELSALQRGKIANAARVSVPGCHATAFVLAINPLVQRGILPRDYPVSCHSLTGYSGGGKAFIEQYETGRFSDISDNRSHPQHYSLTLDHKHLPEMKKFTDLEFQPAFLPTVCDYYNGMVVTVPLATRLLINQPSLQEIHAALTNYYQEERFVSVIPLDDTKEISQYALDPTLSNGTNNSEILVLGNDEQVLVACRLDNLGKGSSGAAIQCMNIMLGLDEELGLILEPTK